MNADKQWDISFFYLRPSAFICGWDLSPLRLGVSAVKIHRDQVA
jgi:hypothetical protein